MILFHQRGKAQKSFNKTKEISTYTLPDDNGTLAIAGNIGSTAIIALVEKPSILYPSNGSSEYNNSITISQYVNNYLYTGTKTHTTIQVSTDSNFNNIVVNNFIPDTNTNARDISLPLDYSNTTLYIRIRYHSGDYCSMWSDTVSIRTKTFTVSIPTILTPSSSLEATPVNLLITTGNFNYIGVSDTHYSTHYQVSTNEAFTSLYYNVESTTSLKSAATTLEEGVTYYIRVRYRGTKYGYSAWSNVVKISTLVPYVHVPTILTPSNNSTGISNTLSISTNVFKFTGVSDTHMSTHYQISTVSNFASTIVDSEDTTNKTSKSIVVDEGVTYYIRVRYRGTKYGYSDWSNVVKISTLVPYVHVPTILTPSNNSTDLDKNITIASNAFKFTGVSDAHYSTHYQVSTNVDMTALVYNEEIVGNQLNHTIPLQEGTTYYMRIRYRGTKYGYSSWSNVIRVSTLVPVIPAPSINMNMSFGHGGWSPRGAGWSITNSGEVWVFRGIDTSGNWLEYTRRIFTNSTNKQLYARLRNIGANATSSFTNKTAIGNDNLGNIFGIDRPEGTLNISNCWLKLSNDTSFTSILEIFDSLDNNVPIISINVYSRYFRAWS